MSETCFSSLSLPEGQLANLAHLGYRKMTAVQAASLPHALQGRDLLAQAKTGSGKTAAFAIALLRGINPQLFAPQALILCPTRELCTQVASEVRRLARYLNNIKILTLCGGQPIGPQIGSLAHGAHIIVGTPGRIQDHLRKETLSLDRLLTLVLDEADRMLDMGFLDAIEGIIKQTPRQRQTLLFSATYPADIEQLSQRFQRNPLAISVDSVHQPAVIEQIFYRCEHTDKPLALQRLLAHYQPEACVVFCNTKQTCREVESALQSAGIQALALHGDLEQKQRDQILVRFRNRSCPVLIATDVAARGLDIEQLPAVINYDLSRQTDTYVHRIGRTGRAGHSGLAISLCAPSETYKLEALAESQGPLHPCRSLETLPAAARDFAAPTMVTLCIDGGRKHKVRPGDILGALTGDAGLAASAVGRIDIFDFHAYVAIERSLAKRALGRLANGRIKGRRFKIRPL